MEKRDTLPLELSFIIYIYIYTPISKRACKGEGGPKGFDYIIVTGKGSSPIMQFGIKSGIVHIFMPVLCGHKIVYLQNKEGTACRP